MLKDVAETHPFPTLRNLKWYFIRNANRLLFPDLLIRQIIGRSVFWGVTLPQHAAKLRHNFWSTCPEVDQRISCKMIRETLTCPRIGHKWHSEIIPKSGIILPHIMSVHKLASSANLYRFTHFLDFPTGSIFTNCLLGQHPQSPLNGICDTGCVFILNAFP